MSATNRGADREDEDTYCTPGWCAARLLERYSIPAGSTVLDPCAASGELLAEIKRLRPDLKLYAFELREDERPKLEALVASGVLEGFILADFLELAKASEGIQFDYVISNPPYSLAQEFVEACAKVASVTLFLLRINFLGGSKRYPFTNATRPGLFTLPNRPCFTGWGSDATEYAWFVYGDGALTGHWEPLALTPTKVISEWNDAAKLRYPHLKPELVKARKAVKKAAQKEVDATKAAA